ncbi:cuticle protein AMP5-like [Homarus americanus]|uniref:cuticle protein AMP5-like n=1 Tax=Homarus americanus TaxID=6706 RepID=UPI001C443A00|nr:cuticle protein AMP5-like [Homarus americanus]
MKLVVFACLVAVAVAAPQIRGDAPEYAEIIAYENEDSGDGNFRYSFQTSNGINQNARGYPGSQGQSNIEGSFSFPLDDGRTADVTYIADENGFQPQSDLIPVAPPNPAHVEELLQIVAQLKAQGAQWNDQGERIN